MGPSRTWNTRREASDCCWAGRMVGSADLMAADGCDRRFRLVLEDERGLEVGDLVAFAEPVEHECPQVLHVGDQRRAAGSRPDR